jgi:aldehyde:ferredoxin oxidoreductase
MARFGYHGKILHVDLTGSRSWIDEPDDAWWRRYGGGGLLATEQLLRHTPPGIDPLGPENLLIIASSVVAGHPYAGLVRFTVAAKSPLTGGIGETRGEGPFANALKASGADVIVFHGRASGPAAVLVENGNAEIVDAPEL